MNFFWFFCFCSKRGEMLYAPSKGRHALPACGTQLLAQPYPLKHSSTGSWSMKLLTASSTSLASIVDSRSAIMTSIWGMRCRTVPLALVISLTTVFAQDSSVVHLLHWFDEHCFWTRTVRFLRLSEELFPFLLLLSEVLP